MDRSVYLAQALQGLSAPPSAAPAGPDLGAMQAAAQRAQAFRAANPGQSYIGHNLGQLAANVKALPGTLGAVPGQVAGNLAGLAGQLPTQALGGLAGLLALGRH